MGPFGTALIPAVASVAGNVIDAISGNATNKANARMAQNQMDFEERMSNTQYQRKVKDLEAAGLNPALAYEGGGNNAPSGTTGAPQQPIARNTANSMNAAIAAYNQLSTTTAQNAYTRAQTDLTHQQELNASQAFQLNTPALALAKSGDYTDAWVKSQIEKARGDLFTAHQVPTQFRAALRNLNQNTATAAAAAKEANTRATLNEQEFMNDWARKNLAPYLNTTAKAFQAVSPVIRMNR